MLILLLCIIITIFYKKKLIKAKHINEYSGKMNQSECSHLKILIQELHNPISKLWHHIVKIHETFYSMFEAIFLKLVLCDYQWLWLYFDYSSGIQGGDFDTSRTINGQKKCKKCMW